MNLLPRLGAISISHHHIKYLNKKKIEKRTNKSNQNQINLKKCNKRSTLATPYNKEASNQHTTTLIHFHRQEFTFLLERESKPLGKNKWRAPSTKSYLFTKGSIS